MHSIIIETEPENNGFMSFFFLIQKMIIYILGPSVFLVSVFERILC